MEKDHRTKIAVLLCGKRVDQIPVPQGEESEIKFFSIELISQFELLLRKQGLRVKGDYRRVGNEHRIYFVQVAYN